jgi:hypothetical protein
MTLTLVPLSAASEVVLTTDKSNYAPNELIYVSYSGVTAEMIADKAWITIARAGAEAYTYGDWNYADKEFGQIQLGNPQTPGTYEVRFFIAPNSSVENILHSATITFTVSLSAPQAEVVTASPTAATVLVNGTNTSFDAYEINGNNYFKLRDLASVVSGTNKQFEVSWDGARNAINLISEKGYTKIGGEMAAGGGTSKTAKLSTASIYKDDVLINLTAYTIDGNNYFKLRDIAKAFDIGVTWDGKTSTIGIDTSISYTE